MDIISFHPLREATLFVLRIEFIDGVGLVTGYTAWKQQEGIRVMGFPRSSSWLQNSSWSVSREPHAGQQRLKTQEDVNTDSPAVDRELNCSRNLCMEYITWNSRREGGHVDVCTLLAKQHSFPLVFFLNSLFVYSSLFISESESHIAQARLSDSLYSCGKLYTLGDSCPHFLSSGIAGGGRATLGFTDSLNPRLCAC